MDTTVHNPPPATSRRRSRERRTIVSAHRVGSVPVVKTEVEPTSGRTGDESLGRDAARGGLIGFVLMGAAVFVMALAAGAEAAGSLWIAGFCAVWGGLGFGCMMGAIASAARKERREARRTGQSEAIRVPSHHPSGQSAA